MSLGHPRILIETPSHCCFSGCLPYLQLHPPLCPGACGSCESALSHPRKTFGTLWDAGQETGEDTGADLSLPLFPHCSGAFLAAGGLWRLETASDKGQLAPHVPGLLLSCKLGSLICLETCGRYCFCSTFQGSYSGGGWVFCLDIESYCIFNIGYWKILDIESLVAVGSSCCLYHLASCWLISGRSLRDLGRVGRKESLMVQLLCMLVQGRKFRRA